MNISKAKVKIVIELNGKDIQQLLNAANFGMAGAVQLSEMTGAEFKELKAYLEDSEGWIKEELIETADEACANGDWLDEWRGDFD